MNKPKFSVVAISRNEEKTLPRLLKSLENFRSRGGEVVIVDTGSTDNTVKVARDWGCKVDEAGDRFARFITEEEAIAINNRFVVDDEAPILKAGDRLFKFNEARNHSASLASNDMVCTADCDEEFTSLDIDKINQKIDEGITQFEYHFVFSHDSMGRPAIHFRQSKFYDRRLVKWVNLVHEVLSGAAQISYLEPEVFHLEHWQNLETNRTGYLRGLAVDCFENQGNDRNSHYFARELYWTGRPKSAIKEFERHVAMNRWPAEKAQSMIFIGDCYKQIGNEEKAVEYWQKAFEVEPKRREALMRLAWHHYGKDDKLKTACYAAAALEIPWDDFYANQQGHYTNEPHELLYWAKWWKGDRAGAKYHFDKALGYAPFSPKYAHDAQFFYEYKDQGIDGYMTLPELLWLNGMAKDNKTILELGSWKGRSTAAMLSAGATVTAVDHFNGSADPKDWTNSLAKREDIYATFTRNVGHYPNLIVEKGESGEVSERLKGKKYDVVFIDGEHTEEAVKRDIGLWKDKATKIICGHDYDPVAWPGTVRAVDSVLGKPDEVHGSIWVKFLK